jgi:hypothetical protein
MRLIFLRFKNSLTLNFFFSGTNLDDSALHLRCLNLNAFILAEKYDGRSLLRRQCSSSSNDGLESDTCFLIAARSEIVIVSRSSSDQKTEMSGVGFEEFISCLKSAAEGGILLSNRKRYWKPILILVESDARKDRPNPHLPNRVTSKRSHRYRMP